ncbi:MAG: AtpZ/AtpI family protein [Acidimicrobiales bacterium]|nr:AtpZ/AtpI family protein [Acidimicrobiales bacterium]
MSSRPTPLTETVLHSTGAYELVLSAVVVGAFGYLFDRWLGTDPIFLLAFGIFGFVGAAASLVYRYRYQVEILNEEQP